MSAALGELVALTLRAPQRAAAQIMALRLGRDALWSALALAAILNTMLFSATVALAGDPAMLPSIFLSPLAFFFMLTGILILMVHAFFWTGRSIGGQGDLGDLLALMVWLQLLRAAAQAIMLVLLNLAPGLAMIFSLVTGVWGVWILVCFIAAALHLPSVAHGFAVLILAGFGLVLGLVLIGGLIGLSGLGVPSNV